MKEFFYKMLLDVDGNPSSKRVVTMICTVFFFVIVFCNLFFGMKVDEPIYTTIRDIVIAGLGFSGAEKFASRT